MHWYFTRQRKIDNEILVPQKQKIKKRGQKKRGQVGLEFQTWGHKPNMGKKKEKHLIQVEYDNSNKLNKPRIG